MNFFKTFIHFFISITTAIVFISGLSAAFSDYDVIPKYTLLQILVSAALTAFASVLIFSYAAKTRKQYIIQSVILYVVLCLIMVFMGMVVGWVDKTLLDALVMCLYVAAVYVIVSFFSYLLMKKEADEFNRAIDQRRNRSK